MNCEKARRLLVDYVEDALGASRRQAVEEHVAGCEACQGELSQIESLKESIGSLAAPERDAEFWRRFDSRLSQRLSEEEPAVATRMRLWRVGLPLAAAAALVIASVLVFRETGRPPAVVNNVAQQTEPGQAPREMPAEAAVVDDVDYELSEAESYAELLLAMADYSDGDLEEEIAEEMLALIEEDMQAVSEDMAPYDLYEQSIYDYLEDLSSEELEEMYEGLASI